MEELLRLTRENNAMLKQIIAYLANSGQNTLKDFVVNYIANKAADNF